MKNIVLIGMSTSGKSTVGVILAKLLGMDFLDTDLLIQRETADVTIPEEGLTLEETVCAVRDRLPESLAAGIDKGRAV